MLGWGTLMLWLVLEAKAITLNQLEETVKDLEKRVHTTEKQLEYGGKRFQSVSSSKYYM